MVKKLRTVPYDDLNYTKLPRGFATTPPFHPWFYIGRWAHVGETERPIDWALKLAWKPREDTCHLRE